jgi:hypothetical protein
MSAVLTDMSAVLTDMSAVLTSLSAIMGGLLVVLSPLVPEVYKQKHFQKLVRTVQKESHCDG